MIQAISWLLKSFSQLFPYNFRITIFFIYAELNRRVDCAIVRIGLQDQPIIVSNCHVFRQGIVLILTRAHTVRPRAPRGNQRRPMSAPRRGCAGVREASGGSVKFPAYCRRVRFRVGWCLTTTTHSPPSVPATRGVNSEGVKRGGW